MHKLLITFIITSFATFSALAFDYNEWSDLTEVQIASIKKMEARGVKESTLIAVAKASRKRNNRHREYIPPHTQEELIQVQFWAQGDALLPFAELLGYTFDKKTYKEDCPNWAIFGFGKATATQYIKIDVLSLHSKLQYALHIYFTQHPETFEGRFLKIAEELDMMKYLVKND
jgi:hypothetical protein